MKLCHRAVRASDLVSGLWLKVNSASSERLVSLHSPQNHQRRDQNSSSSIESSLASVSFCSVKAEKASEHTQSVRTIEAPKRSWVFIFGVDCTLIICSFCHIKFRFVSFFFKQAFGKCPQQSPNFFTPSYFSHYVTCLLACYTVSLTVF